MTFLDGGRRLALPPDAARFALSLLTEESRRGEELTTASNSVLARTSA